MNAPVLVALEERAGASDQDRDAWLAQRASGITGTQIRDLHQGRDLGGNHVTDDSLVRIKLGIDPDPFVMNRWAAWGNEREPFIAAEAERRYGLVPESRVFRSDEDPRFLISPDGVGVDFDQTLRMGEYKTGNDISVGSVAFVKKGYMLQMQWSMFVTGAHSCLYVWEERIDVGGGKFAPGQMHFELVYRDEKIIAKLVKLARRFLLRLDAATADPSLVARAEPEPIDEVLDTHAVNYLRAQELENEAKALKAPAWQALLAAGKSQVSALARVTFKAAEPVEVEDIDYDAARATAEGAAWFKALQEAQAAWDRYCEAYKTTKTVTGRPTLRVTAVKTKGQGNGYDED